MKETLDVLQVSTHTLKNSYCLVFLLLNGWIGHGDQGLYDAIPKFIFGVLEGKVAHGTTASVTPKVKIKRFL